MNLEDKVSSLSERVAVNEQSAKSAHARIDQLDQFMREEIRDLKADMKIVLGFLERSRGMVLVVTVGAGVIGWVINLVVGLVFHK